MFLLCSGKEGLRFSLVFILEKKYKIGLSSPPRTKYINFCHVHLSYLILLTKPYLRKNVTPFVFRLHKKLLDTYYFLRATPLLFLALNFPQLVEINNVRIGSTGDILSQRTQLNFIQLSIAITKCATPFSRSEHMFCLIGN